MSRRGRRPHKRRADGVSAPLREPSGKLARSTVVAIDAVSPAAAKRLRDAAARGMASAEWGTELGRMFLAGDLDALQYEAGRRWGRLRQAYWVAIGALSPEPKAQAYERAERSNGHGDAALTAQEAQAIVADMHSAERTLALAGKWVEPVIAALCERDAAPIGSLGRAYAKHGLNALATHWHLTN